MMRESEKKEWEIVLVYKLDRFSRDKYDSAVHKHTLKQNGIKAISATENIPESAEIVPLLPVFGEDIYFIILNKHLFIYLFLVYTIYIWKD